MDELVKIEGEKSALFKHLDHTFPLSSLSAVAELAPAFCGVLCKQLEERLIRLSGRVFPGSHPKAGAQAAIEFEGREFRVHFAAFPLTQRDSLPFMIFEYAGESVKPPTKVKKVTLTSVAQYKSITYSIDEGLPLNESFLYALTRGIFSAGSQWFSDKLANAIRIETEKIQTGLYDYMRSMLAEKLELLDGFLFSCLMDKKDFVVLNEFAAKGALRLADERALRYEQSRESIVLNVFGQVVPEKDSVILAACEEDSPTMAVPLNSDSKYYRNDQVFFDSMAAVWNKEVTCHPIVRTGDFRVVAFYPSSRAEQLTPLVQVHAETLQNIATSQAAMIRQHLKLLETVFLSPVAKVPDNARKWVNAAEIVGVLTGAFTGVFTRKMSE